MIYMVDRYCFGEFVGEIAEMHRLRYRVFKQRLNWDVTVSGDMEIDEYDALHPVYLLYCGPAGKVEGCVRLLPTTGPNMLRNTFPALLGSLAPPESPAIWEISRFSLEIDSIAQKTGRGLSQATYELLAGICEFGNTRDLKCFAAVTDVLLERVLRRAGVPWRRIHNAQRIGNSIAVAGFAENSKKLLDHLCAIGGLRRPVLTAPMGLKETA
jgi:N-acyl-L-homoserine lactone synthetase